MRPGSEWIHLEDVYLVCFVHLVYLVVWCVSVCLVCFVLEPR